MLQTKYLSPDKPEDMALAGEILRRGGLVGIPTETVYGLAADACNPQAVKNIYRAKGRPGDNPLIVHISAFDQLLPLVRRVPPSVYKLAEAFWPGPLTLILPKSEKIPHETSGGLDTVAVRLPASAVACRIIDAAGCPLAAPSANLSGRPSPTSFSHVQQDLTGLVDALVDGGDCPVGVESTVLSLAGPVPRLLRPGGVTVEELEAVIGPVEVDRSVLHRLDAGAAVASPGMKYRHYAPKAEIIVAELSFMDYQALFRHHKDAGALCFEGEEAALSVPAVSYGRCYDGPSQAHGLFAALHTLDQRGMQKVFARPPQKRGVGLAVYNRLIRAAAFRVLRPAMHVVGLTGPTGSGKSTVAAALQACGAAVIDCDAVTRQKGIYAPCMDSLCQAFGWDILMPGGNLNRHLLAERAFSNTESAARLNQITLPVISKKISDLIFEHKAAGTKILVLDAPTLFEAGADSLCDKILVVTAPQDLRRQRVMTRDGITPLQADRRMGAQKSEKYYVNRADWVIDTGEGLKEESIVQVLKEL